MADFQNVGCFVFEQSIMFHKSALQNVHYTIPQHHQCVFLTQSKNNQALDL